MSHHVTATATNPSGAVEVVRVATSTAAAAPLDLGSTGAGGLTKTAATQVEGVSRTVGANLPVENIEAASNAIQRGKHDLAATAGAETRLNGLDGVGGGGGGGGGDAGNGAVAANNPDVDQLKTQTSLTNAPDPSGGTGSTTGSTTGATTGTTGTTTGATTTGATTPGAVPTAANPVGLNGLPEHDSRSIL